MSFERKCDYVAFKFWEKVYDLSFWLFGHLPITYDVKNKMNMAYMRYHLHKDHKK